MENCKFYAKKISLKFFNKFTIKNYRIPILFEILRQIVNLGKIEKQCYNIRDYS